MPEGVIIGRTAEGEEVVLDYAQRRQHTYVIGVNGTGKTTLLRQIACSDMLKEPRHGLCVIDPHGDLVDDILTLVPESRLDDVILFDPSDEEHPFCLNLFAPVPAPEEIGRVASEIVAIFRKIFGKAWTPEVEGVIENATLTLLCRPPDFELDGKPWVPALDEIPALLAMEMVPDEDRGKPPWKRNVTTYRSQFYRLLQERDQIPVWEFWNYNFDALTPRPRSELTFAALNQVRRLLANPIVRNTVAQTQSRLDLAKVMNEGKILLVKLSKGLLGEANSAFLGSVIVAKLVVAVFARAAVPPEQRRPFHVICDEFQNFAISSFPTMLSEARKFGVDLVIAHQYRDQLRDWVQGATVNAGNTVSFRVGGNDALELGREFDITPPEAEQEIRPIYSETDNDVDSDASHSARIKDILLAALERALRGQLKADRQWDGADIANATTFAPLFAEWVKAVAQEPSLNDGDASSTLPSFSQKWVEFAREMPRLRTWANAVVAAPPKDIPCVPDGYGWLAAGLPLPDAVRSSLKQTAAYFHRQARSPEYQQFIHRATVGDRPERLYKWIPGRRRTYLDVYEELANELSHLPNFHAHCKLAGSDKMPVEFRFRTTMWPKGYETESLRESRRETNGEVIRANTVRDFTRPRAAVVAEFKARYETMLRSIGMSWSPGEPLPKPQVLYEEDD